MFNSIPIILNLLTNRNIALIYSVTICEQKTQRVVHVLGAFNINYSTTVFNFDVCRLSKPVSSTNSVQTSSSHHLNKLYHWRPRFGALITACFDTVLPMLLLKRRNTSINIEINITYVNLGLLLLFLCNLGTIHGHFIRFCSSLFVR